MKGIPFVLICFSVVLYCCSKQEIKKGTEPDPNTAKLANSLTGGATTNTLTAADTCGSCSNIFTGNWVGTGPHTYPDQVLDLSCSNTGTTVTLTCTPNEVPNMVYVYDKNNTPVVTTGWLGYAHCSGSWGPGPVTTPATSSVNFTYNSTLAPYKFVVRTDVRNGSGCGTGGCTDQGCLLGSDNWTISITCAGRNIPCPTCPVPPDTSCKSCNKSYTGTYALANNIHYYIYPDVALDLSCALNNSTVSVGCVYYDVPNTFIVLDKNNNTVANTHWGTTDWIGWANCTGPWGSSIQTNQSETYISFTYTTASAPYKLRVATNIVGCTTCDPKHTKGCEATSDTWLANIFCKTH